MSGSKNRREAVPKYFITTPEKPVQSPKPNEGWGALIFGLFVGGLGVFLYFDNVTVIGGIVTLIGVVIAWNGYSTFSTARREHEEAFQRRMSDYRAEYDKAEPKPTDSQMDQWLEEDINEIKKDALEKLDLNDEDMAHEPDDPIMVIGPGDKANIAIGKDGIIRFSIYDILLVYLTEYHLAAYKCTLDFASKVRTYESTQEYHYTDVVSVSTRTASDLALTIDGQTKSLANYQQFALSVASGESINVATPISFSDHVDQWVGYLSQGKFPDSGADKAIRVIRNRLREKKGGAVA
jgi:hypothetical protein